MPVALMAQQGLAAGPASPSTTSSAMEQLSGGDNPLLGSVPAGKVDPNPINLTMLDAIDRGLKNNLGLILSEQGNTTAAAQRLRARSVFLPNIDGQITESVLQNSLAAFGLSLPGMPRVVGPFTLFEARATLQQNVLDFRAINNYRASGANINAAKYSYQNTRDLVVLAVGGTYLQALALQSRVEATQAELATAEALYKQTLDQKNAGVVPAIDVLRAQVQMQAQQQRLVVTQNDLDKQLLQLSRVIGLPPGQQFRLADKIPAPAPLELTLEQAIQRAYESRADYKQLAAQVEAAEHTVAAAKAQRYPTLGVQTSYGDIGHTIGTSNGVFNAAAALRFPIFEGGRIKADVQQADAALKQRRAQYEDMRGRVEYEVRTSFLDYQAATRQLEVATSALDLARQQLTQARDRYAAGVTNNLEVVQAQEAEATAQENFISSLFAHNFSKLAMARALGVAEDATKRFLGGK